MKKSLAYRLAFAGVIGALYAALSIFGSVFGLTYGPIQLRFAEALTVLPFLFPETDRALRYLQLRHRCSGRNGRIYQRGTQEVGIPQVQDQDAA